MNSAMFADRRAVRARVAGLPAGLRVRREPGAAVGTVLPPGPRSPSVLQAWQMVRRPYDSLIRWGRNFGEEFTLTFPWLPGPYTVFSRPEHVRQILRQPTDVLCGGSAYRHFLSFFPANAVAKLGGQAHRKLKQTLLGAVGAVSLEGHRASLRRIVVEEAGRLTGEQPVDLRRLAEGIAPRIAELLILGENLEENVPWQRASGFLRPHAGLWIQQLLFKRRAWLHGLSDFRACARRHVDRALEDRRHGRPAANPNTVLYQLLERLAKSAEGSDRAFLVDTLLTLLVLFLGGIDSTLEHVFFHLAVENEAREKAVAVSRGMSRNPDGHRENYLTLFAREVRRLSPDLPGASRLALKPLTIGRYHLPAGAMVTACSVLSHRRAETFDRPDEFHPERFAGRRYGSDEYYPFGGGIRSCLGQKLATFLTPAVLQDLLEQFEVKPGLPIDSPVVFGGALMLTRRAKPIGARLKAR